MTTETAVPADREVPLDQIECTGLNPRTIFDEEALESLARSIEEKGLLQPILLRPAGENGDGPRYELVSGERRYRAHQKLGRETIRAEIRELTAQEAAELRLVENIEREDLHPLEEAAAYEELLEGGWSVEDVADQVGRSERYVYARRKLQDLSEEARKAFLESDAISFGHAQLIARLDDEEQKQALQAVTRYVFGFRGGDERDDALTVAGLRAWIDEHLHLNLQHAPFSMDDEDLYPEMGACRDCPFRTGNQPELFDGEQSTVCTKPSCFEEKVERTIRRKVREIQEDGIDPVPALIDGHVFNATEMIKPFEGIENVYSLDSWRAGASRIGDDERCEHATRGVIIDGPDRGEVAEVCIADECEEHGRGSSSDEEDEPDPVEDWTGDFRMERYRWRSARRLTIGRRVADLEVDFLGEEAIRVMALRLFDNLWSEKMESVVRFMDWPEKPRGHLQDEDPDAIEWRKEIHERLEAMDRVELLRFLWAVAFGENLNANSDTYEGLEGWEDYSAQAVLRAHDALDPDELRKKVTEKRLEHSESTLVPEYVDQVLVSDEEDDAHLVADPDADESRCGVDADGRPFRPDDGDINDVDICERCLRSFFEDHVAGNGEEVESQ